METLLATIITALFDAFGEAVVRAQCDKECARRKMLEHRADVNSEAEGAFGPLPPDTWPDGLKP